MVTLTNNTEVKVREIARNRIEVRVHSPKVFGSTALREDSPEINTVLGLGIAAPSAALGEVRNSNVQNYTELQSPKFSEGPGNPPAPSPVNSEVTQWRDFTIVEEIQLAEDQTVRDAESMHEDVSIYPLPPDGAVYIVVLVV